MILVTAAMPEELQGFMPSKTAVPQGVLIPLDDELYACCLGTGKTASALMIQECLSGYAPKAVLHIGICGAADPSLRIGDIVIPQWAAEADAFLDSAAGTEVKRIAVTHPWEPLLASLVRSAAGGRPREDCGIASGDRFFSSEEKKRIFLSPSWSKIAAVDMESYSAAQACRIHHVPLVIIKAVSDDIEGRRPKGFSRFLRNQSGRLAAAARACYLEARKSLQ